VSGTVSRWQDLRRFTTARVGLGRVGNAQPTSAHLDFQAAHAEARDAVWSALDAPALAAALEARLVASEAGDRRRYLLRPDLGRRLRDADRAALAGSAVSGCCAIVIADGLNALGVQAQALDLVGRLRAGLAPRAGRCRWWSRPRRALRSAMRSARPWVPPLPWCWWASGLGCLRWTAWAPT
jgi:ethanolamine ammonia-lyase small subunit